MTKFLIIEEPGEEKSIFYNFAVLEAGDDEEEEAKYLENVDVDLRENDVNVYNLDEIEEDYYHYLEVGVEKVR